MKEKVKVRTSTSILLGVVAVGITAGLEKYTGVATGVATYYPAIPKIGMLVGLWLIAYIWLTQVRRSFLRKTLEREILASKNCAAKNSLQNRASVVREAKSQYTFK